jgi:tetratricopeptide (TPR) repeat protein
MKIFISHTHADRGLADALRDLIKNLFGDSVTIAYSSDQSAGGGINLGESWLSWIMEQVKDAKRTFVLLTPRSTSKPWVLWETGAVTGAATASGSKESVAPVIFRVDLEQIPSPMAHQQGVNGEDQEGVRRLLQSINKDLDNRLPEPAFNALVKAFMENYLSAVLSCLADQPIALNEAAVEEWVSRIEDLRSEKRFGEVKHIHRALLIAYGESGAQAEALLDQRIHRRLGEIYLAAKEPKLAAIQFDFALRTGSRDILLLHKLALAETEASNLGRASEILDRIALIDPEASVQSAEVAGIRGRVYREKWKQNGSVDDLRKARDAYLTQMEANPTSYYMADNVGQLSLALGEAEKARNAFQRAAEIIGNSHENSVWSNATLATAAIASGDEDKALAALTKLMKLSPSPMDIESVVGGLERVHKALGLPAEQLTKWKEALGR